MGGKNVLEFTKPLRAKPARRSAALRPALSAVSECVRRFLLFKTKRIPRSAFLQFFHPNQYLTNSRAR